MWLFYGFSDLLDLFVNILLWIIMDDNGFKFVKVMDYSDFGELIFIGFICVDYWKECLNCFVMFLKMGNCYKIFVDNGKIISEFYRCLFCKCRIKVYSD